MGLHLTLLLSVVKLTWTYWLYTLYCGPCLADPGVLLGGAAGQQEGNRVQREVVAHQWRRVGARLLLLQRDHSHGVNISLVPKRPWTFKSPDQRHKTRLQESASVVLYEKSHSTGGLSHKSSLVRGQRDTRYRTSAFQVTPSTTSFR